MNQGIGRGQSKTTTQLTWEKQPANRTKSPPTLCRRDVTRTGTWEINIKNIQKATK